MKKLPQQSQIIYPESQNKQMIELGFHSGPMTSSPLNLCASEITEVLRRWKLEELETESMKQRSSGQA